MLNKKRKTGLVILSIAALAVGVVWAADHVDAPNVTGTTSDITDYYSFLSADGENVVFVANVQGLISPADAADAEFDEQVMIEFNIDNDNDLIEDLVIQAIFDNGEVKLYGPITPSTTGLNSKIEGDVTVSASVTAYDESPTIGTDNGVKVFAGLRDDPFFMDFEQFGAVVDGALSGNPVGFNDPGTDFFAGTNVLSLVVEVPKSQFGGSTLNTWVESKR